MNTSRVARFFLELFLVSINFFAVYFFLRQFNSLYHFDLFNQEVIRPPRDFYYYRGSLEAAFILWSFILWHDAKDKNLNLKSYWSAFRCSLKSTVIFIFLFSSVSFFLRASSLSRTFTMTYALTCAAILIVTRLFFLYQAKQSMKDGRDLRNILLAGTGRRAQEFISHIAKHKEWGYKLIGLLDRDPKIKGETIAGYPVVGVLEDLPQILEKEVVDEMVFVTPRDWLNDVRKCVLYCEAVGVPATISTDLFNLEIASGAPKTLEGRTYLTVETWVPKGWQLFIKRSLDIIVSGAALVILSPVMLLTALAVALTSPGPILFRQVRSGVNGRKFNLYKFRSMCIDAEKKLSELKEKNEMTGPVFKMKDDPRITPVGKFIRKTSLDEFPQFWNVFKGDMSMVGPRPPIPAEVEKYEPWQRRRLSMKPGITCIWQVLHRGESDFEEWMNKDLCYIDNWSLWLDLKIVFLTAKAVFAGSGK